VKVEEEHGSRWRQQKEWWKKSMKVDDAGGESDERGRYEQMLQTGRRVE
jgi:hypothetical protein